MPLEKLPFDERSTRGETMSTGNIWGREVQAVGTARARP